MESLFNSNVRTDEKNSVGETAVLGVSNFVQYRPGDEHTHNYSFAGGCCHFQGITVEGSVTSGKAFRVAGFVFGDKNALLLGSRSLSEPDDGLGSFLLAVKETALSFWIVPVVEQLP
ncbi:hypothetical protein M1N91_03220, partial [Dehalococcoidia bacterium]|nr:hypothetical protein [Dehalococcoidia bacterium]